MPTSLTFQQHGVGIGDAGSVVRANAVAAGLAAPVPSCPGWSMRDLIVHLGLAQRWTMANLAGLGPAQWPTEASVSEQAAGAPDLLDWFDEGLVELLNTLAGAPEDLQAFFFLKDAPPPRQAWARRQCHELTIHGVDAMAARLGRLPTAAQTWISAELAADGVDELLTGFVPRKSGQLRSAQPVRILVVAADIDRAWTMAVSGDPVVTTTGDRATQQAGPGRDAEVILEGSAVGLYLGLWNRGAELTEQGGRDFLSAWRRDQRVVWS